MRIIEMAQVLILTSGCHIPALSQELSRPMTTIDKANAVRMSMECTNKSTPANPQTPGLNIIFHQGDQRK